MAPAQVLLYEQGEKVAALTFDRPIELGRQIKSNEILYSMQCNPAAPDRLVVARLSEDSVGRRHARLDPLGDGRLRVSNLSTVQPIRFELPAGLPLAPGESREVALPQLLRLGTSRVLRLQLPEPEEEPAVASLAGVTMPPGKLRASRFPGLGMPGEVPPQELVAWFTQAMDLFQGIASSEEFFDRAARAVVETVGMDMGRVLMLEEGEWKSRAVASASNAPRAPRPPSWTVLGKLLQRKAACFETPGSLSSAPGSMSGLDAVVAAPILDRGGAVIGALYGERHQKLAAGAATPVSQLEAMLVELLARSLAAGLNRLQPEADARNAGQLLEQFFTREVARYLVGKNDWEKWHRRPITLLFCDICGFTRIIGKLAAAGEQDVMSRWCRDVLDVLSASVLERNGVLIDYIGDGLLAMWGAPADQPDHAARGCEAALAMLEGLVDVNERWADLMRRLGERTEVHIGLNSGVAQVGNIGSRYKFKYGAQGDPVNIASRVQTANRYFKTHVLISGTTRNDPSVCERFLTRRLGRALLKNVREPVELFELCDEHAADMPGWKDDYERALDLFEKNDFRTAARILAQRRGQREGEEDGAALILLSRAVQAMADAPPGDHPTWRLADK
jgi:adenylate cyclase